MLVAYGEEDRHHSGQTPLWWQLPNQQYISSTPITLCFTPISPFTTRTNCFGAPQTKNGRWCTLRRAVLEVENGARNVTGVDGFVSLGKSSVTKKEF